MVYSLFFKVTGSWYDLMCPSMKCLFYKPHYEFWQTRFLNSLPKSTKENCSLRWCLGHVEEGLFIFLPANELTPVLPLALGSVNPHPSQRSMVHCYSCSCSPFQGKRGSWLNPNCPEPKISADCWERRKSSDTHAEHRLQTDTTKKCTGVQKS